MKKIFLIVIIIFLTNSIFAQELNSRVSINYSKLQTTNTQVFTSLQRDISEFLNTTIWTDYIFNNKERIECNILITITEFNGMDRFVATLQITSTRPVFGTSLTSSILNFKEQSGLFKFRYVENQAIDFNENSFTTNLAYVLAFYTYIIIGYDFDTFSLYGGDPFFQKAQDIVSNAQSSSEPGWKAYESSDKDNRFYLAKDLLSPTYKPLRHALYKYHRLGLDKMGDNIIEGRKQISDAINLLSGVHKKKPDSYLMRIFLDSKRTEIINIFSGAPDMEVKKAANVLKIIDISNSAKYDQMGKEK